MTDAHYRYCTGKILSQQFLYLFFQCVFSCSTDLFVCKFAIFEKEKGRDVPDAILHREVAILVYIAFTNDNLAVKFFCQLLNVGSDHFAWSAPRSPKINDYRLA